MPYLDCEDKELLKVLSKSDLAFISNLRIPHGSHPDIWARKHIIDRQIINAIDSGKIRQIPKQQVTPSRAKFYVQSDYVPDGQIKSMADGKMYDSKSKYYSSLKEKGLVIMDEKPKTKSKTIESDLTGRDVKNAIERLKSR